jgi:hypothetical protein
MVSKIRRRCNIYAKPHHTAHGFQRT